MKQFAKVLFLVGLLVLTGVAVFAQSDTGRLVGVITDPTGAAIRGATVTVTNLETNRVVSATSNDSGNYFVNALPPGKYRAVAQQKDFKTETAEFSLDISLVLEVNFKLQAGTVTTEVDVTDAVPLVETSTSESGEVIQGAQVTELPLNGRNFTQLALLTPGVTRGMYGDQAMGGTGGTDSETWRNSGTGGGALSANGQRAQVNNFIMDGVDNNESLVNTLLFFPPAEAIQEFKVSTSVAPAEFGVAGGAIVQVQTKSGTNSIHGSAFWFNRMHPLDADPWSDTTYLPYVRNQFGGTLGAPIWKNKFFGFVDFQGLRQNEPVVDSPTRVPTALMRQGNFSELLGGTVTDVPNAAICPNLYSGGTVLSQFAATNGYIYNPQTCLPFGWNGGINTSQAGNTNLNIIPGTSQNTVGMAYLNAFPNPNLANVATGTGAPNFQPNRQGVQRLNDYDIRLDFVVSPKETLFGRFSVGQDLYEVTDRLRDATHDLPSGFGSGNNPQHPRQIAVGYTRILNDHMINEFRFAYSRPLFGYFQPGFGVPEAANLGIPNANTSSLLGGMPLIGGWSGQLEYVGDYGPYEVKERGIQFTDAVSWTRGNHVFKFGLQLNHREVDFTQANNAKGYFWIDDNDEPQYSGMPFAYAGHGPFTGYEISELAGGFTAAYTIGVFNGFYRTNNWQNGGFAQDDWHVNRKLTLNLGLRYDYLSWPTEESNRQSNFDPTTGTLVEAGTNPSWPYALINTPTHDFGPRAGFAYDIFGNGRTVVRGGYGLFYYLDRGGVGVQLSNNPDFNGTQTYYACPVVNDCSTGYRFTLSGAAAPGTTNPVGATGELPHAAITLDPKNLTSADNVIYYPRNSSNPNIQEWNLQLERAINSNTSVNLGYVGTHMGNMGTYFNANSSEFQTGNQWFSNVGNINEYAFIGTGNYNGLQARVNRNMTNGLQYTVAYTWSHTLDNSNSAINNTNGSRILVGPNGSPLLHYNYGNSDSDIRHVLIGAAMYDLPFGKGRMFLQNIPKALDYVIGGWQWNNVLTFMTGAPYDVTGGNIGANGRPNYNGGCSVNPGGDIWLSCSPSAFSWINSDTVGNLPRNYFHGPRYHDWDTGITKNIPVWERVKTELRLQAYNLTNTPQFQNPDGNIGTWNLVSGTETLSPNSNFGKENTIRQDSWREVELALRVTF